MPISEMIFGISCILALIQQCMVLYNWNLDENHLVGDNNSNIAKL